MRELKGGDEFEEEKGGKKKKREEGEGQGEEEEENLSWHDWNDSVGIKIIYASHLRGFGATVRPSLI